MTATGDRPLGARRVHPPVGGTRATWRYVLARRCVQAGVLLLFLGTLRGKWTIAGRPILRGDLSASELLGAIPLADPFAVLQLLAARRALEVEVLIGAALVLGFYAFVGGRTFCAWVCPVNPLADLATWLRRRWGIDTTLRLRRRTRYGVLALALGLSAVLGVAAFEWVSPVGVLHRGILFGFGAGWIVIAALFLFDAFAARDGWCGHLCPLGAFYALVGRVAAVRVRFDAATCTRCGVCTAVCPEPQVLNLKQAAEVGFVASGECTNCFRCVPVCPEDSLRPGLRPGLWAVGAPIPREEGNT